jgi:hypothetical protein
MPNLRSSARKQQRDNAPLLVHSENKTASDESPSEIASSTAATPNTNKSGHGRSQSAGKGFRRLFARSPTRDSQRKERSMDIRRLRSGQSSASKDSSNASSAKETANTKLAITSTKKHAFSPLPAVLLPDNAKDSSKKDRPFRPFPVSIRKAEKNPDASDPPARNGLKISTSRSTAASFSEEPYHHSLISNGANAATGPEDVLADLQKGVHGLTEMQQQHRSRSDFADFDEKKADDNYRGSNSNNNTAGGGGLFDASQVTALHSSDNSFEVVYGQNAQQHINTNTNANNNRKKIGQPTLSSPLKDDDDNDYEDATETPLRTKQQQQQQQQQQQHDDPPSHSYAASQNSGQSPQKPMSKTKALLSRHFGRASIPPNIGRKWVVEVSSAEWDADEHRWKYRILVQRRQMPLSTAEQDNKQKEDAATRTPQQPHSMTAAFTWRSLADFAWLERALRQEFHGGLLLPVLSIALGRPAEANYDGIPVESERLRNWFSDTLNGVRGQGELILDLDGVDLLKSEAMEAFLYRNNGPLALHGDWPEMPMARFAEENVEDGTTQESFVQTFFNKSFGFTPLELCTGGGSQTIDETTAGSRRRNLPGLGKKLPLGMGMTCSSRALGSAATLDVQDSFVDHSTVAGGTPVASNKHAIHSELMEAEKDLVLNYRKSALTAMEKLQVLFEEEEKVGLAWKRFAISLSNLFAYEKDAENARLGDSKIKRENMPFRKISKSNVDECLRVMARQKNERSSPALNTLSAMLSAYVADLSLVEPSVDMYNNGIMQLGFLEDSPVKMQVPKQTESWEGKLRALASSTMSDVKRHAIRGLNAARSDSSDDEEEPTSERRAYQSRLLTNEKLLRHSLTAMCRATPVRVARMAWRYWNTEAHQCALLNAAAISLKNKVDTANKETVSKMIKRHMAQEKEDRATEGDLVQRIVNTGNTKKFSPATDGAPIDGDVKVEVDNDDLSEERSKAMRRDKALQMTRERVGRWDAKLALAIMEAVGVEDPNVRVEETTRELRLIRKYAIGLRESLQRCIEAVQLLRTAMKGGTPEEQGIEAPQKDVQESRNEFLVAIAKLFSGSFVDDTRAGMPKRSSPSLAILSRAGVDTSDPFGWSSVYNPTNVSSKTAFTQGRVGDLAVAYMNARDSQTEWLLSSISELLHEYNERIEVVESFVYMECVGIQLEKHFSQKRAQALTAFEKKTDITTAVNIATRKRLPGVVTELQTKLDALGPTVSHTLVKEMKEAHLESKTLKVELHDLALRGLLRAREASTERVVTLMAFWAKEEEIAATTELKGLREAMTALERTVSNETSDARVY